jgi:hypothetical protein
MSATADQRPAEATTAVRGSVVLGYRQWLDARGHLEAVRARLSATARALLDDPPVRTAWVPTEPIDEIVDAVAAVAGLEATRAMGRDTTRDALRGVLRPILENILRRFGTSPASVYARLDLMLRTTVAGARASWTPDGDSAGVVEIQLPYAPREAAAHTYAGALEYGLALCGRQGSVRIADLSRSSRCIRFAVRWT